MHEDGCSCSGWLPRSSVEDFVKIPPSVQLTLDLDQTEFMIKKIYYNTMTKASPWACRRGAQAGWRRLRGRFLTSSGFDLYPARIPPIVLSGISKVRPVAATFVPAIKVLTTHHRWMEVSISRSGNFHKIIRCFTEMYKSLKTNLVMKHEIVWYWEPGTYWVKHSASNFVL